MTYTVVATNAGNITQSAVTVSDPMLTPGSTTCATLAPGATCTLTGTYVVQQSDVDAGKIDNTASVASTQVTTPVTDSVSTPIAAAPALTLDKQAPTGSLTVGSTLTYTVVATNAGNITQSAVTVSDPMLTPGSTTCATLAPGATCTLTGTYVVQQSDVDAGKIDNTASVALDPGHNTGHRQRLDPDRSSACAHPRQAGAHRQPHRRLDPDLHGRRHQRGQHHPECGHGQRSHAHTGLDHLCNARSGRHMHPHRYLCRPAERCRRGQD
ncbi:MAG: hypothetical protein IPN50_09135 [Sphingomonadales bacterium]|nr:hypothetical protein [Sphingomonadales bacterium]